MITIIPSFIAWRYLWHKDKESNIAVMTKICFLGILIGTFALMLTLIITNGFEKTIHEKMRGINAQLVINSPGNKLDFDGIATLLQTQFKEQIAGVSANSFKQVILDHNDSQSVLFLKGIIPAHESSVTTLAQKVIAPKQQSAAELSTLLAPNTILVGDKLARDFKLRVGQQVTLLIPEPRSKTKLALKHHTVTIAGIFKVGLEEYDNNLAFIDIATLNELFDEQGVDAITLALKNDSDSYEKMTVDRISKRFPHLTTRTWKDQYPALVASLKLEKYVMFFILALITLVACMNMISLLFMQIQSKRRDIAIFQAMGLSHARIRSIFLQMGLTITMSASLCGLGLAALAGYWLQNYPFIQLPDVYYISYLPARMDLEIFIVVFCATLLLGFLATWLPARKSADLSVATILRQE